MQFLAADQVLAPCPRLARCPLAERKGDGELNQKESMTTEGSGMGQDALLLLPKRRSFGRPHDILRALLRHCHLCARPRRGPGAEGPEDGPLARAERCLPS